MKARIIVFATLFGVFSLLSMVQSCTENAERVFPESDLSYIDLALKKSSQLTPKERLGKAIFFDNLSSPLNMSCATCHDPAYGFTGPNPAINRQSGIYHGAIRSRAGNRKPPSAAYATLSPIFHYDETDELFVGGNFWDGRATGEMLGNPAADQALGPFLNPVEQNMPDKLAVLRQISRSNYVKLWETVWGEPLSLDSADVDANYERVGLAIAEYEASREVNAFSSKYDAYMEGEATFTQQELLGLNLFENKGKCALCHPAPLFTDFTYDNLGVPKNPNNPWYDMDMEYIDGSPINSEGDLWIDKGLGGFLQNSGDPFLASMADENMGKHKVPTLRNVDKRNGPGNTKAYMHNGVFKSLEEVVNFYNTRDSLEEFWPDPEVADNVNTEELGNLHLTAEEEAAIVAFMKTLSDGYR